MLPDPSRGQQDALGLLLGPGTFGRGLGELVLEGILQRRRAEFVLAEEVEFAVVLKSEEILTGGRRQIPMTANTLAGDRAPLVLGHQARLEQLATACIGMSAGAGFIDAACFLIRVMAAGYSASQAEALATQCPGWQHAPSAAIDVFALASTRLYDEIARNDPQPFKRRLAAVADEWACHRLETRGPNGSGARLP